jgi:SAM-dependent methyltransferase
MQAVRMARQWLILPPTLADLHRNPVQTDEYLRLAEVEDRHWYFRSLHAHARRELLCRHAASAAATLLDAGCGTGGFMGRLMPDLPQWNWAGIDFMPLACRLAKARLPAACIREGSITQLPFPDAAFDAVTALDVISQVSYPEEVKRAFSECHRVLRSGGTLVLNVAAYRWLWSYHDEACQTRHRFAADELRRLAEGAGFDVQRLTHWNALTFPLVVARRKIFPRSAGSDVQATSSFVDRAMGGLMNLEHAWLERGGSWAWGSSLLLVAERR